MAKTKYKCDICGKKYNTKCLSYIKGRTICFGCKMKSEKTKEFQSVQSVGRGQISFKDALNKTYEVKYSVGKYIKKNGKEHENIRCYTLFPSILAGKKFKIKLVEDQE